MFKIRLKELRELKGLTQRDFAEIFGISKGTIGMWESGAREPRKLDVINRIADFFGVSVDYLLCHTDEKAPAPTDEEKPTPVSGDGLDETDQRLMEYVRAMTPDQKQFLLAQMKVLSGQDQ